MVKIHSDTTARQIQHVQEVGNKDQLNALHLEDWLNLDNELLTTEQMSDKQIHVVLATVTGHSNENGSSDERPRGPRGEKSFQFRGSRMF